MNIIGNRIVTTRKPSRCFGCDLKYPAGTRMQRITSSDDEITISYCPVCLDYWSRYLEFDDVITQGDLRIEGGAYWEAIRREHETAPRS